MKKILPSLILIGISSAHASTYQGVVQELDIAATSSGGTRVSVLTSGSTSCQTGDNHWYSFEYSSQTGPGPEWLAALLSAKVTQATIMIHGTGACDASGMERVAEIDRS
ncbi:MAG: hypothetical protein WAU49_13765 [Steroidobacteraceae bacterium]